MNPPLRRRENCFTQVMDRDVTSPQVICADYEQTFSGEMQATTVCSAGGQLGPKLIGRRLWRWRDNNLSLAFANSRYVPSGLLDKSASPRVTDGGCSAWKIKTKNLITFYICRFLPGIIQPRVNKASSNVENYFANCSVHFLFVCRLMVIQAMKLPTGRKVTLTTLLLILFLMQAVLSQGHKELWGQKNNQCGFRTCQHGAPCFKAEKSGREMCDCSLTTFEGSDCSIVGATYVFDGGLIEFIYPRKLKKNSELWSRRFSPMTEDRLALSFRTEMSDCDIFLVYSSSTSEFIHISLEKGRPLVQYSIGNHVHSVKDTSALESALDDNKLHTLVFVRKGPNSTMQVDDYPVFVYTTFADTLSIFDDQAGVLIGGFRTKRQIVDLRTDGLREKSERDFVGDLIGLFFNGIKVFNLVAFGSPYSKVYGAAQLDFQTTPSVNLTEWKDFFEVETESEGSTGGGTGWTDCMFASQFYPPCENSLAGYATPDPAEDWSESGDKTWKEVNLDSNKIPPDCVTCLDPTQNDQGRPEGEASDGKLVGDRFNNPTDSLVQTSRGLRMSTSAAGITIGVVASLAMALLILIFAIYKMRHKAIISQYAVAIQLDEKGNDPSLQLHTSSRALTPDKENHDSGKTLHCKTTSHQSSTNNITNGGATRFSKTSNNNNNNNSSGTTNRYSNNRNGGSATSNCGNAHGSSLHSRKLSYTGINDGHVINIQDLSHLKEWYV